MDYSNESYVRLYVRDTTTWKRLPWQGKALLPLLLRKVDRAGVIALEGMEPASVVAIHTELPRDVVDVGLPRLLELGVVEVQERGLVFPKFKDAQTAFKTNAQRQRELRDRRRAEPAPDDEAIAKPGQDRNAALPKVTASNDPVTDSNAGHSTAQYSTVSESSSSEDTEAFPDTAREDVPSGDVARYRRQLPDAPGDILTEQPLAVRIIAAYKRQYAKRLNKAKPPEHTLNRPAVQFAIWCEDNAESYRTTPADLAKRGVVGLFESDSAAEKTWPLGFLAYRPADFVGHPEGCKPVKKANPVEREIAHPTHAAWKEPEWMRSALRAEDAAEVRKLFAVPAREIAS